MNTNFGSGRFSKENFKIISVIFKHITVGKHTEDREMTVSEFRIPSSRAVNVWIR